MFLGANLIGQGNVYFFFFFFFGDVVLSETLCSWAQVCLGRAVFV